MTSILSLSVRLVLIFWMFVSDWVERTVGRGQIGEMFAECFELGESEIQLGILVGEMVQIIRRLLKVFHGVRRFGGDRFDDFQHFRRGFAQIGCAFAWRSFRRFLRGRTLGCPG